MPVDKGAQFERTNSLYMIILIRYYFWHYEVVNKQRTHDHFVPLTTNKKYIA